MNDFNQKIMRLMEDVIRVEIASFHNQAVECNRRGETAGTSGEDKALLAARSVVYSHCADLLTGSLQRMVGGPGTVG